MDEFDGLLILMLLRDSSIEVGAVADWIGAEASGQPADSFEPVRRILPRVHELMQAHQFNANAALCTLWPQINPSRLLELCRLLGEKSARLPQLEDRTPYAKGGLGQVWKARDVTCSRFVALKQMREDARLHPSLVRRFLLEARTTARLEHPSIVPVYWISSNVAQEPAYVMRFLEGETLQAAADRLHAERRSDPKKFAAGVRDLTGRFLRAGEALAYAHSRGVIHRDLKPANIILSDFGSVFLIDWGLAKQLADDESIRVAADSVLSSDDMTHVGDRLGTPLWMAPEQAVGEPGALDKRTDVYGLGATLFTVLTGRPPHFTLAHRPPAELLAGIAQVPVPRCRSVVPELSPALDAICAKAMEMNPADRYRDVGSFIADLQRWLAGDAVSVYREPTIQRLARWAYDRPIVATPLVILLLTFSLATVLRPLLIKVQDEQMVYMHFFDLHHRAASISRIIERSVQRARDRARGLAGLAAVRRYAAGDANAIGDFENEIPKLAKADPGFDRVEVIALGSADKPANRVTLHPDRSPEVSKLGDGDSPQNAGVLRDIQSTATKEVRLDIDRPAGASTPDNVAMVVTAPILIDDGDAGIAGALCVRIKMDHLFANVSDSSMLGESVLLIDDAGKPLITPHPHRRDADDHEWLFKMPDGSAHPGPHIDIGPFKEAAVLGYSEIDRHPHMLEHLRDPASRKTDLVVTTATSILYLRSQPCGEPGPLVGIVLAVDRRVMAYSPLDPGAIFLTVVAGAIGLSCIIGLWTWRSLTRIARSS